MKPIKDIMTNETRINPCKCGNNPCQRKETPPYGMDSYYYVFCYGCRVSGKYSKIKSEAIEE